LKILQKDKRATYISRKTTSTMNLSCEACLASCMGMQLYSAFKTKQWSHKQSNRGNLSLVR